MANTWTTTRSLHSGFKRSGADLVTTITSLNTAIVFSSKSRSGYVLNPDLLSEVDFCRMCGFVFTDKRRKKNKGEFAKMFESGWCESFGGR